MDIENKIKQFIDKAKKLEKGEKLDLSSDEDLSIGLMNLISIEEHLFFTYNKTGKDEYLVILNQVREIRKSLLKKLLRNYEGEAWCASKHLLAASMRVMEVGTKALTKGETEEAKELFQKSYQLYSLFWCVNLDLLDSGEIKQDLIDPVAVSSTAEKPAMERPVMTVPDHAKSENILSRLGQFVQKMIDCCKE